MCLKSKCPSTMAKTKTASEPEGEGKARKAVNVALIRNRMKRREEGDKLRREKKKAS